MAIGISTYTYARVQIKFFVLKMHPPKQSVIVFYSFIQKTQTPTLFFWFVLGLKDTSAYSMELYLQFIPWGKWMVKATELNCDCTVYKNTTVL